VTLDVVGATELLLEALYVDRALTTLETKQFRGGHMHLSWLSDGTLSDRATTKLVQPSRRMIRSMTQDPDLGLVQPIAITSEPIISWRITRSKAHIIGPEHQLLSLLMILVD